MRRLLLAAFAVIAGSAVALAQEPRVIALHVEDRTVAGSAVEITGGVGVVRVIQGDQVELHWTTDEATELHLHGYDVTVDLPPAGAAVMRFEARATGRFAVEGHGFGADHDAEETLLYVEVHPR